MTRDCGVQSPGMNFTLKSSIFWNYTVQIRFYSIFSLHPACEVSAVFIVVESICRWPKSKTTKHSSSVVNTSVCQDTSIVSQESSSSDVEMEVQSPQFIQPSTSQPQPFVQPMFMPYIEGPKMDWTVNDSLYHRFLRWKLKCENILDCELAMLPDSQKCKTVIV